MFTPLPLKLIVDSRAATIGDANRFSVSLPETLHLERDIVMYVNSASVTNTFLPTGTIVGTKQHYFYWFERLLNVDTVLNRAVLSERAYTAEELALELKHALNAATWFGDNQYDVVFNVDTQTMTVSRPFDGQRTFFIPSNTLMQHPDFPAQANLKTVGSVGYSVDWQNTGSALGLFGLDSGSSANVDYPALLQLLGGQGLNTSQVTGAIDVRRVHNVYIHSQALSSNNVISLGHGARSTLVKIPVFGQVGDVLHRYHSGHAFDFVDCGNKTLSTLDFELRDGRGNPLDIRGGTVSIELIVAPRPIYKFI